MKKILISLVAFVFATSAFAKEVTLLMDWFPQGNQSGYWQAEFDNRYHTDVTIKVKAGGPKVNTTTAVASGQVEFGLQASDSVMLANAKGAGLKGIFVSLDHVPLYTCLSSKHRSQFCQGFRWKTICGQDGCHILEVGKTYLWFEQRQRISIDR